ncbi:MAG: hypothetical protein AAF634_04085 [Bacteroidota bacterium]
MALNNKSTLVIPFFLLGCIAWVNAQGLNLPTDFIRNNVQGNNLRWEEVEGSPYLNEEFQLGKIQINDTTYNGLLRYNAYSDEIEMNDNNEVIGLLKRPYVKAVINSQTFGIHSFQDNNSVKQGYFIELTEGVEGKTVFLQRIKRVLIPAQEATSSYKKGSPARLVVEDGYYIKTGDQPAVPIRLSKKSILAALADNEQALKTYVAENKLKLKSVEEVISFIQYSNTL